MSIRCIANVLDLAPAHWPPGTRMVALALADRVNQDWEAWPSLDDIATRSGLTTRMVRSHLRQLEAEGVIANTGQRIIGTRAYSNLWIWLWRTELEPELRAEAHFRGGRKPTSAHKGGSPLPPNR